MIPSIPIYTYTDMQSNMWDDSSRSPMDGYPCLIP